MKRLWVLSLVAVLATGLLLAGCLVEAFAGTPPRADFPEKGKPLTFIVPYAAGGGSDMLARILQPMLEKELGTPVLIVNKPGGGAQVGTTQLARSKPDGYTIGFTNIPTVLSTYLDPDRKAAFSRKDFQPVTTLAIIPMLVSVKANSPYKSLKDLLDAAKANPGKIKFGTNGLLSNGHLALLVLEKATGVKFAAVHFDGGGPLITSLLGGHIDVNPTPEIQPYFKSGEIRVLGMMNDEESKFFPGVKTVEAQGYKAYMYSLQGLSAPAGVPKEIVDILSRSIKKVVEADEVTTRFEGAGYTVRCLGPEQFGKVWEELEAETKPLIAEAKQQ